LVDISSSSLLFEAFIVELLGFVGNEAAFLLHVCALRFKHLGLFSVGGATLSPLVRIFSRII
jgi:hypothetical protein